MIYIPTLTSILRYKDINTNYVLYSPNKDLTKVILGNKITIWDNYTFYLRTKCRDKTKALSHYFWLIDFIKNNYVEGITLVTPDVEWLNIQDDIEKLWIKECADYPQLYVPTTWKNDTSKLNIVGHAIRAKQPNEYAHNKWTHCLGHKRDLNNVELVTYDKFIP